MKEVKIGFPLWHALLVCSILIIAYLIVVSGSEALALYRLSSTSSRDDGHIVLNLRFSEGRITLHSKKRIPGTKIKSRRHVKGKNYYFKIISEEDATLKADYFSIASTLHYDTSEVTGDLLKGGEVTPAEVSFIVRIPTIESAKKIEFFKVKKPPPMKRGPHSLYSLQTVDSERIGEIAF